MAHLKAKKIMLVTALTLVALICVTIACISPITKFLVEKYSVKYLGRQIKMSWLYLNPFTGYVHISHLKVYEVNSDSCILTADGLSAGFSMFKMLHKTYEISSISLDKPVGYIIQDRKLLNFSDLIERFTPKTKRDPSLPRNPVHFNILNISISDGEFHYIARTVPINYFVKNVNVESSGKWWNVDSMIIKFTLQSGPGNGNISGNGSIDFDSLRYRLTATIRKFDLKLIDQYLQALANYGHVSAILDAKVEGTGSFKNGLDLDAGGFIALSDFHFGEKTGDDFASFDKLVIDAKKINPINYKYFLDSIMIAHPFFKYERYDYLNNIERMFGKNGSRIKQADTEYDAGKFNLIIQIARYVKELGTNFLNSYYKINKVAIYNGDVKFNDFSLLNEFSIEASPLNLVADSIDKNHKRFAASINAQIKPFGNLSANLNLDPNNYGNFYLQYKILQIPVSIFNPYLVTYTSFPLNRGRLEFNGYMSVKDSAIQSENHLLIVDARVAKRIKGDGTKWLPVPLIMSIIRSSGNAIDFQIPIAGNLSDPKFKFRKVIGDVVRNIIVKPSSTAYLIHEKQVEKEVDKSLTLTWRVRQDVLEPLQEKFVKRMAGFLKDHADASISVSPWKYTFKEEENILLFEARKKYFQQAHNISSKNTTEADSMAILKLSVKDSDFVHYLDKIVHDSMLFTIQQKCEKLIGREVVANSFAQLVRERETIFKNYFGDDSARVKFIGGESSTPFDGFSFYKIEYKGEAPKSLLRAYREMERLNEEAPRKKYIKERESLPVVEKGT